jgi:UDP-4-amino-4,6-dideoxy-N-acetyl-beta-L-altrosamine N-acetyltransferase
MINRKEDHSFGAYRLKNFVRLDEATQLMILAWRNHEDVRRWMFHEHEIKPEDHLEFIKGLEENDQNFYWLVEKDGKPIGVAYLNHLDSREASAEWGFYTNPEYFNSFAGLEIVYAAISVFTRQLHIHDLRSYVRENNSRAMLLNEFFGMEHQKWVMVRNKKYSYRKLAAHHISSEVIGISQLVKSFSVFLKNKKVLT